MTSSAPQIAFLAIFEWYLAVLGNLQDDPKSRKSKSCEESRKTVWRNRSSTACFFFSLFGSKVSRLNLALCGVYALYFDAP